MHSLPSQIGGHRIVGLLGEGGMGAVYRAEHGATGVPLAIKTLRHLSVSARRALRREVRLLSALDHPGVVGVREHGEQDGVPWVAMDLVEGRTLREQWSMSAATTELRSASSTAPLTWVDELDDVITERPSSTERPRAATSTSEGLEEVLELFWSLCVPLAWLHGEGLVHRDLKPDNVVLRSDGRPVLVDFGLARSGQGTRDVLDPTEVSGGTAGYMAPEQVRGDVVDARADLYALGCMLYEWLTGTVPFTGSTAQVLFAQQQELPVPPSERATGIPAALEGLVLRLLDKSPRSRPGHAEDVAAELIALGLPPRPWPGPRPRPYLYRPALVGRSSLVDAVESALREPGVHVLAGPSGMGKTRVAIELARRERRQRRRVLIGDCPPDTAAALQALAAPALALAEANLLARTHLSVLHTVFPLLPGDAPEAPAVPAEAAKRRLVDTAVAVVESAGMLLLVDDVQWADAMSIEVLNALAATPTARVLCTARPGAAADALVEAGARTWEVGPLDADAIEALLADMLGADVPAALVQRVREACGGNAFFVAEALRAALEDRQLIRDTEGRWSFVGADWSALPIPASVQDAADARIAALSAELRAAAGALAVFGRNVPAGWIGEDAASALLVRHIAQETPRGVGLAHDQLRDAALRAATEAQRIGWHRAAAEHDRDGPAAVVARHLQAAGDVDAAREAWERAERDAVGRGVLVDAAEAATHRVELSTGKARIEARLSLGRHLVPLGALDRLDAEARAAIDELADLDLPDLEAEAHDHLALAAVHQGRREEAERASARAVALAVSPASRGRSLINRGRIHYWTDRQPEALAAFDAAVTAYEATDDDSGRATALGNRGLALRELGRYDEAHVDFDGAIALLDEDSPQRAGILNNLAGLELYQSDFHGARRRYRAVLKLHLASGARRNEGFTRHDLGETLRLCGEHDEALEQFSASMAIFSGAEDQHMVALCGLGVGSVHFDRNDLDAAETVMRAAHEQLAELGVARGAAMAAILRARVAVAAGRIDHAGSLLDEADEGLPEPVNVMILCDLLLARSETAAASGDLEAARAHVLRGIDVAVEAGLLYSEGELQRQAAVVLPDAGHAERALAIAEQLRLPERIARAEALR